MTARGVRNSVGKAGKAEAAEAAESRTKESTGKLGSLLGRTLAKVARSNPAQHVTNLPVSALLLQALDVADVARGQGIDYPITSTTSISTTFNTTNTTTTGSDPTDVLGGQPPAFSFPANVTGASGSAGDADAYLPTGNLSGFIESSTTAVMSTLPIPLPIPSSTMATLQAQTVATFIAATGSKNRPTTIVVYPTVSPESIVIPIVSCIFGFPILALLVICCLRRRAKLARERDRRRNYDMQDHAVSLVRFSPIHRLTTRRSNDLSVFYDIMHPASCNLHPSIPASQHPASEQIQNSSLPSLYEHIAHTHI